MFIVCVYPTICQQLMTFDLQVRHCLPDILLATLSILYTQYKQLRYIGREWLTSRPFPPPVFDCLLQVIISKEGLIARLWTGVLNNGLASYPGHVGGGKSSLGMRLIMD